MKNHSAAMKPTMNLDTSAQTLNLQSDLKAAELEDMIYRDYHCTDKHWSDSPSSPFTTTFGEGLINAVYERRHLYHAIRVGLNSFQVTFVGSQPSDADMEESEVENEDYNDFIGVPIPLFERIREVTIDDNQVMHCSCCKFEGRGIFCEHEVCVADCISEHLEQTFDGFTHKDIALRYRSAFMHLAYRKDTPDHIQAMFHVLASKEVTGPTLKESIPDTMTIMTRLENKPAIDRLKNYNKNDIDLERIDGMFISTFTPNTDSEDLDQLFESMLEELQSMTTPSAQAMFDESVFNYAIPEVVQGVCARNMMRSIVDTGYALADRLGVDGIKKFEETVLGFNTWASEILDNVDADKNKKRKYVPISQEVYSGKERVLNTKHMR